VDVLGWLLVSLGAGVLLLVADRAVAAGLLRRRPRRPRSGGGASGALGELVEIFQPSHEHVALELERRRLDIVQSPGSAPAVDLEAGIVRLPRAGTEPPTPVDPTDARPTA
jgi:hypothetical protein